MEAGPGAGWIHTWADRGLSDAEDALLSTSQQEWRSKETEDEGMSIKNTTAVGRCCLFYLAPERSVLRARGLSSQTERSLFMVASKWISFSLYLSLSAGA